MKDLVEGTLGNTTLFSEFAYTDPHLVLHNLIERPDELLVRYESGAHKTVYRITEHHEYTEGIMCIDI